MKICFMKGVSACDRYRSDCRQILANMPSLEVTQFPNEADILLQFFCIEDDASLLEAAYQLQYLKKLRKPTSKLIVAGCAANVLAETFKKFEGVDYVISRAPVARTVLKILGQDICENKYLLDDEDSGYFGIEISEGCQKSCGPCNFCFNSLARIPLRSKPMEYILEAVENAVDGGAKDIWIMGLNTTIYGIDFPDHKPQLHTLIRKISEIKGISRISVISLVYHNMYEELLDELASNPLVSFIEIGTQTGSNRMHSIMNTGTTVENIEMVLKRLSHKVVQCLLIVGHPEETQEDFVETLKLIYKYNLWNARITPYIFVDGTPASQMKQVPKEVTTARVKAILHIQDHLKKAYLKTIHRGQKTYCYPYDIISKEDGAWIIVSKHGESSLNLFSEPIYDEITKKKLISLPTYSRVNCVVTGFDEKGNPIVTIDL